MTDPIEIKPGQITKGFGSIDEDTVKKSSPVDLADAPGAETIHNFGGQSGMQLTLGPSTFNMSVAPDTGKLTMTVLERQSTVEIVIKGKPGSFSISFEE